ncbi:MAG TPA: hypothetical protein VIH50_07210 [Steroidobacteraceae bacterium]|jgi:hypothetical protein
MHNVSSCQRWQESATCAAQGTLIERWRRTTEWWLGAREHYYALATADVRALCNAAQRWHDLAIRRLALTPTPEEKAE